MNAGVTIAITTLVSSAGKFNPEASFELQLSDARVIRESAAVIANASEEEIIDALKKVPK